MFYTKISYSVSKNAGKKDVDFRRTGTLSLVIILPNGLSMGFCCSLPGGCGLRAASCRQLGKEMENMS